MGNCCRRCLNILFKRHILRQYTALDSRHGPTDENATLVSDDNDGDGFLVSQCSNSQQPIVAITENEKLLLKSKNYAALINSQKGFDEQIDRQLAEQEERLRREEEELIQLRKKKHFIRSTSDMSKPSDTRHNVDRDWPSQSTKWSVAGGSEDFDMFVDSVAYRSVIEDRESGGDISEEDFVSSYTPQ